MSLLGSLAVLSATEALVAITIFCLVFITIRSYRKQIPQGLKKIPGPVAYPVIGNMLEIGKNPHLSLTRMRQKYGDIMMVHIGTRPVLVLSGLDTIKQALVRQGGDFMGRPDLYSFRQVADGESLAFGNDSGEVWLARRKLAQNALKNFAVAPCPTSSATCLLEEHVSNEMDFLIQKLQEVMREKKRFDPFRYLVISVANVVCAMCFGKRYNHEDQELLNVVNQSEEFGDVAASGNPADFIPLLQYLPSMKKFKEFNQLFLNFLQKIVQEHYATFNKVRLTELRVRVTFLLLPFWVPLNLIPSGHHGLNLIPN